MNKFGLLLYALLAISYAQSSVIDRFNTTDIFEKLINITKVMANSTEYKCAANLTKNKSKVMEVIEKIINEIKGGKSLFDVFLPNVGSLVFLTGFYEDCNIVSIINNINFLKKDDGIQKFGHNVVDNALILETLFNDLMTAPDLFGKLLVIVKVIKITTGFSVQ